MNSNWISKVIKLAASIGIKGYLSVFLAVLGLELWYINATTAAHMQMWVDYEAARSSLFTAGSIAAFVTAALGGSLMTIAYMAGASFGGAPGGQSPTEKGASWAWFIFMLLVYISVFNGLWLIGTLVFQFQSSPWIPFAIFMLVVMIATIIVALGWYSQVFLRVGLSIFAVSLVALLYVGLHPLYLHDLWMEHHQPPAVAEGIIAEETMQRIELNNALEQVSALIKQCNMSGARLAQRGTEMSDVQKEKDKCYITPTHYKLWQQEVTKLKMQKVSCTGNSSYADSDPESHGPKPMPHDRQIVLGNWYTFSPASSPIPLTFAEPGKQYYAEMRGCYIEKIEPYYGTEADRAVKVQVGTGWQYTIGESFSTEKGEKVSIGVPGWKRSRTTTPCSATPLSFRFMEAS